DTGYHHGLGAVQHVPQLDHAQHVLVEHRPAIVDPHALGLLLEAPDGLEAGVQALGVAEHGAVAVHRLAELVLELGYPAPVAVPADDRVDPGLLVGQPRVEVAVGHGHLDGPGRGILAGPATEDQGVEQRVGAQPVAAVHRDAGAPAGGVE